MEEGNLAEHLQEHRCRARIDHLESVDLENVAEWNNMRVKRILVDYMLRMSYYETATKLAQNSNIEVKFTCLRMSIMHLVFACISGACFAWSL